MNTHEFFGELEDKTYKKVNFAGEEVNAALSQAKEIDEKLLDKLASLCKNSVEIDKKSREALTLAFKTDQNFIVDFLHNIEEIESETLGDIHERCVNEGEDIPPEEFAQALQLKEINLSPPSSVLDEDNGTDCMIESNVENKESVMMLAYDLDGAMWEGGIFVYFNIDGEFIKVYYVKEW